ncbi:hypothetical protein P3W45_000950 [Vairimorpha bombi]
MLFLILSLISATTEFSELRDISFVCRESISIPINKNTWIFNLKQNHSGYYELYIYQYNRTSKYDNLSNRFEQFIVHSLPNSTGAEKVCDDMIKKIDEFDTKSLKDTDNLVSIEQKCDKLILNVEIKDDDISEKFYSILKEKTKQRSSQVQIFRDFFIMIRKNTAECQYKIVTLFIDDNKKE